MELPNNPEPNLSRLLLEKEPWYRTFLSNLKDAFSAAPPPPAGLTSQPIPQEAADPWYVTFLSNLQDALKPSRAPRLDGNSLGSVREPEPFFASFISNVKEVFFPPKLPPLDVTSKPVYEKAMFQTTTNRGRSGVISLVVHGVVIGILVLLATNKQVQNKIKEHITLVAPDLAPFNPTRAPKKSAMGGGGGGGDRSPLPASKGRLPKFSPKQFTPPMAVVNNPNPKLIMEPTLDIQPNAPVPQVNMAQFGDPLAKMGPPSNGTGSGAGIGSGPGGGVGSGSGPGYGPGRGGNFGGGVYKIGGDVSQPVPLFKPDPEYSEEARKAKFQGSVILAIVVDETGKARDIRVVRPLGLGLDEKAIEAVMKWRFKPAVKQGKAVAVSAQVEINFRLL